MQHTHTKRLAYLVEPMQVCRAYSEGKISWRRAALILGLDGYDALRTFAHERGYAMPLPDIEESRTTMTRLDNLLYDADER